MHDQCGVSLDRYPGAHLFLAETVGRYRAIGPDRSPGFFPPVPRFEVREQNRLGRGVDLVLFEDPLPQTLGLRGQVSGRLDCSIRWQDLSLRRAALFKQPLSPRS